MKVLQIIAPVAAMALLAACSEEIPPRSVSEFIENPILLEAALVRCTRNRAESRYEAECVNAREAVMLTEAKEDSARRAELEAQSKRKRDALRRTQRAAAEARRRAVEARKRREEAEYLAQFGELPPVVELEVEDGINISPEIGSNAPVIDTLPDDETVSDLESIRDELRRRNDEGNEQ